MPVSYRPSQPVSVLEVQHDLVNWWNSPIGTRFADGFIASTRTKPHQAQMFDASWQGQQLAGMETMHLRSATTYVLTAEMIDLADHAAKTMRPQPLRATDLPSRSGFMWFDRPYVTTDIRAMHAAIKAIVWAPVRFRHAGEMYPGIQVSFYTDPADPNDEDAVALRSHISSESAAQLPKLLFYHLDSWLFERTWEQELLDYIPHDSDEVRESTDNSIVPSFEERRTRPVQLNDDLRRFLQSVWTIMQQPLIATHQEHAPDRAMRRRLERSGEEIKTVKVIVLRRIHRPSTPGEYASEPANYSFRFIVDAHWHTYHFKEGPRQLWLMPYLKGDPSLPLDKRERVYHWKR